jgi:hypothetical protein
LASELYGDMLQRFLLVIRVDLKPTGSHPRSPEMRYVNCECIYYFYMLPMLNRALAFLSWIILVIHDPHLVTGLRRL